MAYNEAFTVGGEKLMYPGDSAGSASNIINCRCTATAVVGDFEPTARRGKDPVTGESSVFSYKTFNQYASDNGLTTNNYGQLYKK